MKKLLCLLLTLTFLVSLAACTPTEGETTNGTANTSASAESTEPEETEPATSESEPATEPENNSGKTTPVEEDILQPPYLVLNEDKFPTITSIKIRKNDFTTQTPTEEELTNFLCEVLFYYTLVYTDRGYYRIPSTGGELLGDQSLSWGVYQLDPDYVKNRDYWRSVLTSYFDFENQIWLDSYLNVEEHMGVDVDVSELDPTNVYVSGTYHFSSHQEQDASMFNIIFCTPYDFLESGRNADSVDLTVLLYTINVDYDEQDPAEGVPQYVTLMDISLVYKDGVWKMHIPYSPAYDRHQSITLPTPLRDDFGNRLTIEKPD